ncbi:GDSL esterase/lipase At5g45910-like [Malus domestica]|uniref:GDSL esterase/lipase At5g45910-like n=1 Tax=Malus domestica TaxID=3750 RepID=UPI003976006D
MHGSVTVELCAYWKGTFSSGNDYDYALFSGWSIEQAKALVPPVVDTISKATSINRRTTVELVVPGKLPTGCSIHNDFSKYHKKELKRALGTLIQKYPSARILYADYYGASKPFYHAPQHYGQIPSSIPRNSSGPCSTTCKDPNLYAHWDGIHHTEAAYRYIAMGSILDHFTKSYV